MKWLLAFLLFFPVAGYAQTGYSPTSGIVGGNSMPDLSERAYLPPSQWAENRAFYSQNYGSDCSTKCYSPCDQGYSSSYYYGYGNGYGYGYNGYGYGSNGGGYAYPNPNQRYNNRGYQPGCNYTNPNAPGFRTPSIFR